MNVLFKLILGTLIVVGIFTAFGLLFPQSLTTNIDNAIIYFFAGLNNLSPFVHVATIKAILLVIMSYVLGLGFYYIFKMFYHMIT